MDYRPLYPEHLDLLVDRRPPKSSLDRIRRPRRRGSWRR